MSLNSKYFKKKIALKYSSIIQEYFELMNQSDIIKQSTNPNPSLYLGMNAIHRVFEYILLKTRNIDNAYLYCKKCYFYYLEYIEQIHNSDLSQNLNYMDAILFIYKKSIFDIHDDINNDNINTTISNIMTLNSDVDYLNINDVELKQLLNDVSNFTKILFFWDNANITFHHRQIICNKYLNKYLLHNKSIDTINSYLVIIQEKTNLNYAKYDELLDEILDKIDLTKKVIILDAIEKQEILLTKFYIEEEIFKNKFHQSTTKDLVKWLFV